MGDLEHRAARRRDRAPAAADAASRGIRDRRPDDGRMVRVQARRRRHRAPRVRDPVCRAHGLARAFGADRAVDRRAVHARHARRRAAVLRPRHGHRRADRRVHPAGDLARRMARASRARGDRCRPASCDRGAMPRVKKSDATRKRLLARALVLFQKKGVEQTTMRDIAKAAGLSLGAAYYYFPSKDALVFSFYEDTQRDMEALAAQATGTQRERLGALFHGKLESIKPHRKMLAAIVQRLDDPGDTQSAFSQQSHSVRERANAVIAGTLDLPDDLRPIAAHALWMLMLALMLVYINDDSPGAQRPHRDDHVEGVVDE